MSREVEEHPSDQENELHTILVVEDDEAIGDLLLQTLKGETSHAVLLVTNAVQALEAVESIKPHLFILDYHLPGIDGIELCDRLRAMNGLESVPTLMLSAQAPSRQALQQRKISFLKKPFDLAALLKATATLLAQQEAS